MLTIQYRAKTIMLFMALALFCFSFQGYRGIWEPDEGRYTAVSMEMLKSKDWLRPHLHYEKQHWTKPPVTYWTIASSVLLLGKTEFAARFPNSVTFFLTVIAVYYLGKIFTPERPILPPLLYISFLFPVTVSNIITTDTILTLWETAGISCFAYATWVSKRDLSGRHMLLMWAAFGIAFMTKGPPALLPLASILIFRGLVPEARLVPMRWLPGLFILILIGFSWYVAVITTKPSLAKYFIWDELILRIFSSHHHRNDKWYYIFIVYGPVLVFGTMPWTITLIKGVRRAIRSLKTSIRHHMTPQTARDLFLLLWILIPLTVFFLSKSRLPLYVLPIFAPMAILAAQQLQATKFRFTGFRRVMIIAWLVFLISARIGSAYYPLKLHRDAKLFAHSIESLNPGEYDEIVFFKRKPVMGLVFYLNVEVERVSSHTLAEELLENERRIWIIESSLVKSFLETVANYNRRFHSLGRIESSFELFKES